MNNEVVISVRAVTSAILLVCDAFVVDLNGSPGPVGSGDWGPGEASASRIPQEVLDAIKFRDIGYQASGVNELGMDGPAFCERFGDLESVLSLLEYLALRPEIVYQVNLDLDVDEKTLFLGVRRNFSHGRELGGFVWEALWRLNDMGSLACVESLSAPLHFEEDTEVGVPGAVAGVDSCVNEIVDDASFSMLSHHEQLALERRALRDLGYLALVRARHRCGLSFFRAEFKKFDDLSFLLSKLSNVSGQRATVVVSALKGRWTFSCQRAASDSEDGKDWVQKAEFRVLPDGSLQWLAYSESVVDLGSSGPR